MAKLEITVCDVCGALDRSTTAVVLGAHGRSVALDLCDEHAEPVTRLMVLAQPSGGSDDATPQIVTLATDPTRRGPRLRSVDGTPPHHH
jgi:hypothetical protein